MLSANLKNKITSTYASHKGDVELEARFGLFTRNRFKPGVTRQIFNRIKAYFDEKSQAINIKTTDYIMGNVRKTIVNPEGEEKAEIIWITKNRLWSEQLKEYGIRYSMALEIPVDPVSDEDFKPQMIREKNRSTYYVFNRSVKIDITLVNMIGKEDQLTYEVEIELVDPSKLTSFEKAIEVTLRLVLDTIVLYPESLRVKTVNEINSILGSTKRGILDHYPLVQARNLKLRDMVYGGLIGNEDTGYSVTHKADGQRRMLYFSESGIWLAAAPNSLTRVTEAEIKVFNGTILDGEMIPLDKRLDGAPKSRLWYLSFDALAWNRDNSISNQPHGKRMNYAQTVADKFKGGLLTINTKSFKILSTPQEFFKTMREMFREQLLLTYKQDGFMFTPQNTVYNPHSDIHPLYKRKLTEYPDICKWKPKDELTIDFLIKWRADPNSPIGRTLELYSNVKGKPVLFKEAKSVDVSSPLTLNLPNNTVVEYGYDYEKDMLIPYRVRHDKTKPNKYDIALDVWSDISTPIDKETMMGETFTLMRRYHNRIKRGLFTSNVKRGKYLLDIGSGRGGDVFKWKDYKKIVAVEPNPEHIEELKRRLEGADMLDKVYILQAGGEETNKIKKAVDEWIGEKVDTISTMLSLTFFWQSSSLVDSLANTFLTNLKKDGEVLFLTMDGDLVQQTFDPAFKTGLALKKLELGPATLTYFGDKTPKELHVDIKDSIVTDQTEWLVRLDDLLVRMKEYGFDFKEKQRANEEKFLTEEEIIMTQMYTYGYMGKVEKKVEKKEEKKVEKKVEKKEEKKEEILLPLLPSLPPTKQTPTLQTPTLQIPLSLPPTAEAPKIVPKKKLKPKEKELGAIPMDSVAKVNLDWWDEEIVRIGAIGDGSCFFHSVLNAYLKVYQINPNVKFRKEFVKNLRRDISLTLELPDPKDPNKIRYETASGGQFTQLYEQQLLGLDVKDLMGDKIDFSLEGLKKFFDSNAYIGDETYGYLSELLNIDIFVMRLTNKNLYVHLDTSIKGLKRRAVVISGNGYHFETIGIERGGLYQTFFNNDDPFIVKIKSFSS